MPRRELTADEKVAMQEARIKTKQERAEAMAALCGNPQFMNPKFWKSVDADLLVTIEKSINKAKQAEKNAKIAKLEAELAVLKGK